MSKKEITYTDLVKITMAKIRKDTIASGKQFDTKLAFSSAAARWKIIKDGKDKEFSQGKAVPGSKKTSKKTKSSKCKSTKDVLSMVDLCDECKLKIKDCAGKKRSSRGTRKTKL